MISPIRCLLALLLVILCTQHTCYAQTVFPYHEVSYFDWSKIEIKTTLEERKSVINSFPEDSFYRTYESDRDEFPKFLHAIDINNDGRKDYLYNWIYPGEGLLFELFLNTGNQYTSIFTEMGRPGKLEFQNGELKSLYLVQQGCCADPRTILRIYNVAQGHDEMDFILIFESQMLTGTQAPETLLDEPIHFQTLNDKYYLRSSPEIIDEPYNELLEQNGNQIAQLSRGTRGRALAESTDPTGRVWWFVEIDLNDSLSNAIFGLDDRSISTYKPKIAGWISSRFVKRL